MPKSARKKVDSGMYHVVLRGINKQTIFFDDEDREVFLNRLKLTKEKRKFEIYGFCLMGNHIHLLIKEDEVPISKIFMMALSSYVLWYNHKYKRIGNISGQISERGDKRRCTLIMCNKIYTSKSS